MNYPSLSTRCGQHVAWVALGCWDHSVTLKGGPILLHPHTSTLPGSPPKADCGVVVHRDWERYGDEAGVGVGATDDGRVKIMVQKMRNKAAGKIGSHELVYDRVTGRYEDTNDLGGGTA